MTKHSDEANGQDCNGPGQARRDRFFFDFSPVSLAEGDCSALKKAVEILKGRGIKDFRSYFEQHPEEVVACYEKLRVVDVNSAMVDLFEAGRKEDLLGGADKFFNDDSFASLREGLIAYAEGETSFESEGVGKTFTGKKLYLIIRWFFPQSVGDTRNITIGSFVDITGRKAVEYELRMFKAASDRSIVGNAILNLDGMYRYVNDAYARMHGYTKEELEGKHASIVVSDEYKDETDRLNKELMKQGAMENIECRQKRKDGSFFPIVVNATVIKGDNGEPAFILFSMIDDSRRKKTEEDLRKFKTISDRANVGNAITDRDGTILYVNPTLARIYGYEAAELIGEHASIFHADDQRKSAARRRRMLVKKGSIENVEIVNKRKDGSVFPALLNATLIKDDAGETLFTSISVIDISDLKNVELRLRQREEELEIKNLKLKEMNATLKVLLTNREEEKTSLEEKVLTNVKELAMPVLGKLKKCGLDGRQEAYVDVLETSLTEIVSPFMHTLASKYTGLTQAELEVANLVKDGKNIKEIGRLMNLSGRSVETYRTRIRKKLGIAGKKVNLRTYLLSFN